MDYNKKLLQAILFTKHPHKYFNEQVLSDEFMNILDKGIDKLNKNSLLNFDMKKNILELLNFIRFNSSIPQVELFPKINEWLRLVRSTKVAFYVWQAYLFQEYNDRNFTNKDSLDFTNDNQLDDLFYSLELDFTVLKSLTCSQEEFEDAVAPQLVLNDFYFSSIKQLIAEDETILDSKDYVLRIIEIIGVNEAYRKHKKEILDYDAKTFKKVIKHGNILFKKMIK